MASLSMWMVLASALLAVACSSGGSGTRAGDDAGPAAAGQGAIDSQDGPDAWSCDCECERTDEDAPPEMFADLAYCSDSFNWLPDRSVSTQSRLEFFPSDGTEQWQCTCACTRGAVDGCVCGPWVSGYQAWRAECD